jgi:hypothetical protein
MIVGRVDGALLQQSNQLLGIGSGQDFTTLPQDLEALASEPQSVLAQFRAGKARAQSTVGLELESAQNAHARAYRDYRAFRILHKLTDTEPHYDTVIWRKVFWLAALFVVEVTANGWMIGQASPGDLVQGWSTALMISVLVVLTGSLLGAGPWRYINYCGADGKGGLAHKLWAVPAMLLGVGLLLLFAFYIAHYRYQLAESSVERPEIFSTTVPGEFQSQAITVPSVPTVEGTDARPVQDPGVEKKPEKDTSGPTRIMESIVKHTWDPFQQLESLLLFVIALLIGIFAIHRGAYWDDPYPGYGQRHRKLEEAREYAEEVAQGLGKMVDEAKTKADSALQAIATHSEQQVGALRQAIAKTQENAANWDYTAASIMEAGRNAVQIYRRANLAVRSTTAPASFGYDAFDGDPPASTELLDNLRASFKSATANITACKSQIAGARGQLEAEYHSFYDDELTPFLKSIEGMAHANARQEFVESKAAGGAPTPASEPSQVAAQEAPLEPAPIETLFRRKKNR